MTPPPNESPQNNESGDPDFMNGTPTKRRRLYNRAMKWIRRIHMCLGLFMFPWVFLYSITGFLLNHPGAFPDHEIRKVDSQILEDTELDGLPAPDEAARGLLHSLAEMAGTSLEGYKIIHPERARYSHQGMFNTTQSGKRYQLALHPNERSGKLHIRPVEPRRKTPLGSVQSLQQSDLTHQRLRARATAVFRRLGIPAKNVYMQWGPLLEFQMTDGDQTWIVNYNLSNQNIGARPREGWPGISSIRQYLLRLHLTHTFPTETGSRTFWAIMVDAVAACLVLWALSGLLIWWQRKNLRLAGAIITGISVLWACGLGYIMYQMFKQ